MSVIRIVPQAERSKHEATQNIERKIRILEDWLKDGIPYVLSSSGHRIVDQNNQPMLDYIPRSLRDFKAWDGTQNCEATKREIPSIRRIANDTLANRPELEQRASVLMHALQEIAAKQTKPKGDDAAELKLHLKRSEFFLHQRMAEERAQQIEIRRLRRELSVIKRRFESEISEFQNVVSELNLKIKNLQQANRLLMKRLAISLNKQDE